jgi:hypothetical protein
MLLFFIMAKARAMDHRDHFSTCWNLCVLLHHGMDENPRHRHILSHQLIRMFLILLLLLLFATGACHQWPIMMNDESDFSPLVDSGSSSERFQAGKLDSAHRNLTGLRGYGFLSSC